MKKVNSPSVDAAKQIKDSCRASVVAAAKSVVELNPKTNCPVWNFNAGETAGPDGDPLKCMLNRPHAVYVRNKVLYIADSSNHRIRTLTPA